MRTVRADVLHDGAGGGELLGGLGELGVVAGEFFEMLLCGLEGGFSGGVVFVEDVGDGGGGGLKFFSVEEDALLGFEGFVFAGFRGGGVDFASLEGPEVGEAEAVLLVMLDRGEAFADVVPAGESFGDGFACRVGIEAAEAIEEGALLAGIEA